MASRVGLKPHQIRQFYPHGISGDDFSGRSAVSRAMRTTNLGKTDGLPTIEWSQVEMQLADLLTHDDPRAPNRASFWLATLNGDGSPHVTSVGSLWHAGSCWFQTGERTQKAKNVARPRTSAHGSISVAHERGST